MSDPRIADDALLAEIANANVRSVPSDADMDLWERDCVPEGEQDHALTALAGFVRSNPRWRFSESGIEHLLAAVAANGTLERSRSRRPWTERDFARIARSIAAKPVGEPTYEIDAPKFRHRRGDSLSYVGPPVRWWLRGFVPYAELVMLYGPKAAGKSTTGSWLASLVTRRGGRFLHIGVEEPFERFLARAVLGGADRSRLYSIPEATTVRLPSTIDTLTQFVTEEQIDVIYFDSIYSHFDSSDRQLESTRTRACLGPLSAMCQSTGATAIGVFHDRRADGDYMGSTEMVNVARVILRLSRQQGQSSRLHVRLTNFTAPDHSLRLDTDEHIVCESDGTVQMEEQADGTMAPMKLRVVRETVEVPEGSDGATSESIERPRAQNSVTTSILL